MIFSIDEKGDLCIDKQNNTYNDHVAPNETEANFKIARTCVITYFKHKNFFQKDFLLNYRNNFTDAEIRELIQRKLDSIFLKRKNILSKIGFTFSNLETKFLISFYYKISEYENRSLLYIDINIWDRRKKWVKK